VVSTGRSIDLAADGRAVRIDRPVASRVWVK
jgi:hypothetical protein